MLCSPAVIAVFSLTLDIILSNKRDFSLHMVIIISSKISSFICVTGKKISASPQVILFCLGVGLQRLPGEEGSV